MRQGGGLDCRRSDFLLISDKHKQSIPSLIETPSRMKKFINSHKFTPDKVNRDQRSTTTGINHRNSSVDSSNMSNQQAKSIGAMI